MIPRGTMKYKDAIELIKKIDIKRELQFKSHNRSNEILIEQGEECEEWKAWQWCFTHERYEKAGWIL